MIAAENIGRRNCIPILYTAGTHYDIGFDTGRNFASIIQDFLSISTTLNEEFLPAYATPAGKKAYEETLASVQKNFPQYVKELKGIADGAKVPFHKLFLLHLDNVILPSDGTSKPLDTGGCTTICVNKGQQEILGHNEDALNEDLNHFYFVSAHVKSDTPQGRWGVKEERFTSLCYAGHLPGYTMSYNSHGLIFSINTLSAKKLYPGKTPRHFLTRALLAAENLDQAIRILRNEGTGVADGCSINLTFLKDTERIFYNIEIGPQEGNEARMDILPIPRTEHMLHVNNYRHLQIEEVTGPMVDSSVDRLRILKTYEPPTKLTDVTTMLSDSSGQTYKVFRDSDDEIVKTIAVGIFDCVQRTWSIYADNPKNNEPLVVLPLVIN